LPIKNTTIFAPKWHGISNFLEQISSKKMAREYLMKGRLSTINLLIDVACLIKKVDNIFNTKRI
jgi:hypothetical protein